MSETKSQTGSFTEKTSDVQEHAIDGSSSEIDLLAYHEHNAGRLVVDPEYVDTTICVPRLLTVP